MKNKKGIINIVMFLLVAVFLISLISAEVSYCCEKTTYGAWCQNEDQEKCDSEFQKSATSCEATSYCRNGCCYNSQEGNCMSNTPQRVCNQEGGVWSADNTCDIPQCELGCCLIGKQAAFVTQTRCKRLSNLYGLSIDFRTDIGSELSCVLSATSDVEGACVFIKEFEKTCRRTTQKECNELKAKEGEDAEVDFYEGHLCSDEELGTNCAPSDKTTCVEGDDAVFYIDTCGNIANVYDASKYEDKNYWAEIKDVSESCNYGTDGNPNSRTCGNCDYLLGTTCKEYDRSKDAGAPNYGDNICRDLGCKYEGQSYDHGESFCVVFAQGKLTIAEDENKNTEEKNLPGSRHFRLLCYNNEIIVEPCADFRQEICLQDESNGFLVSACRVNRWQECIQQDNKDDCENENQRDCEWIGGDKCAPKYSPGFDFWAEGSGGDICKGADKDCKMVYEKRIGGDYTCEENCDCDDESWKRKKNEECNSLGDCGMKENYLGHEGYYDMGDLYEKGDIEEPDDEGGGGLLGGLF